MFSTRFGSVRRGRMTLVRRGPRKRLGSSKHREPHSHSQHLDHLHSGTDRYSFPCPRQKQPTRFETPRIRFETLWSSDLSHVHQPPPAKSDSAAWTAEDATSAAGTTPGATFTSCRKNVATRCCELSTKPQPVRSPTNWPASAQPADCPSSSEPHSTVHE